jgi:hypothetical protein
MRAFPCKCVRALKLFSGYEKGYVIRYVNPSLIKLNEREGFLRVRAKALLCQGGVATQTFL